MLQKDQTKALLLRLSATAPRSRIFRHSPRGAPARLVQARDRVAPICTPRTLTTALKSAVVYDQHSAATKQQRCLGTGQQRRGARRGQAGGPLSATWSTSSEIES